MSRLCYLDVMLNRSKYYQRSWTYQESCLSGRLLYITAKGVTYHCSQGVRTEEMAFEDRLCGKQGCNDHTTYLSLNQRNLWREYIGERSRRTMQASACTWMRDKRVRFFSHQLPVVTQPRTNTPIEKFYTQSLACHDCIAFEKANEAGFHTYKELVRGYTYWQFEYESDRIPAFAGIAGLLSGQYDKDFLYDMPEKHLDFAMLWIPRRNSSTPCRRAGLTDVPSWSWASHEIAVDHRGHNWMTSEVDWYALERGHTIRPIQSIKHFGAAMPMREDFSRPVTLDQLHAHGLIEISVSKSASTCTSKFSLVGWCQIVDGFFTKGHQLYGSQKQLVCMPSKTVYWSDVSPPRDDPKHRPVKLLFLSRVYHQPLAPLIKSMEVRQADWILLPYCIHCLVVQRAGNVARRLAIADIHDVELWASVSKRWMLMKLI